jgi:hypothetical protein
MIPARTLALGTQAPGRVMRCNRRLQQQLPAD